MASAKQIAWRKKFARMSKAGKFKKSKKSSTKSNPNKNPITGKPMPESESYRMTGGKKDEYGQKHSDQFLNNLEVSLRDAGYTNKEVLIAMKGFGVKKKGLDAIGKIHSLREKYSKR